MTDAVYTDDTAILTNTPAQAESQLYSLEKAAGGIGLCVNLNETEYLCYIARYTDVWNRHRESEIHDIHEIGSGTKLYYLWVKGYLTWGGRDTIFLCWLLLYLPQTTCGHCRKQLVWPWRASKVNLPVRPQELNSLLFLKSQRSSAHASGAWCHSHPWSHFLSRVLFWHLWMMHPLRTCVNTCAQVCT